MKLALTITHFDAHQRLDIWLSRKYADHSRARWQALIKEGRVLVNGVASKASHILSSGESIDVYIPPPRTTELEPEEMPLDILFEDTDVLVLNKPVDLVVHPAPGHATGTLVHALLHHCDDLEGVGGELRPGIVHRLDKDTSGVMVIVKNERAMQAITEQFRERDVKKEYVAVVWGHPAPPSGTIDTSIGRHPTQRKKMTVDPPQGRRAVSHYQTVEILGDCAYVRINIDTGRTHQIRVHMAHLGYPVLGDSLYGRSVKNRVPVPIPRHMLHAHRLCFTHPSTNQSLEFCAPLPDDMRRVIQALRGK